MPATSFLTLQGNRRIAYHALAGALPQVVFLTGFKSDMTGSKATALESFCRARGQAFLRFDYTGHGQSSGEFIDGTIGSWKRDVVEVLSALGKEQNLLVGSSMGAWLGLLAMLENAAHFNGFIGIASAPDFTEKLIWEKLTDEQRSALLNEGVFYAPSCYGEAPYPITKQLIEEGREHLLLTSPLRGEVEALASGGGDTLNPNSTPTLTLAHQGGGKLNITCPVHLLHGTQDQDVPVEIAHRIMEKIPHAKLTLIEGGDHRLSTPENLEVLCNILEGMLFG